MPFRACRCAASLFIVLGTLTSPVVSAAAQPPPDLFEQLESLESIPAPRPMLVRPRVFAAYGALIAASMLSILYLYRGRAFIVYWIGSWLLMAASLTQIGRAHV